MTRIRHRFIELLLTGAVVCNLNAQSTIWKEFTVPMEISTSIKPKSFPRNVGWVPSKKEYGYALSQVCIEVGVPNWEWFQLKCSETNDGQIIVYEWDMSWVPKGKKAWVECSYHYTQAELLLPLPEHIKKFRVTCSAVLISNGFPQVLKVEFQ